MTTERAFLDTNVFLYVFDDRVRRKQRLAEGLVSEALRTRLGVVSYQVVQEFLSVAVRKFKQRMPATTARVFLERILWPMCQVFPDLELYNEAISIREETGWDYYDSLIVSAAVRAGCPVLLTEDLQAGRVIRGVEIQNPFG